MTANRQTQRRSMPVPKFRMAALVASALLVALIPSSPAAADPLADAKAAAHAAALDLARLQPQVDTALANYELALQQLGQDVSGGLTAQETSDEAAQAALAAAEDRGIRIRAIFRAGGPTALVAALLNAESPADLASRMSVLDRVLSADGAAASEAQAKARAAAEIALARQGSADRSVMTAGSVEANFNRLDALLGAATARLDELSGQAKSLQEAKDAAAALTAARAAATAAGQHSASTAKGSGIPADFLPLYKGAAATCPGLDWHIVAAIGQVESGHGRNNGPSSGGAMGPMQFLPSTFRAYAVDGNHDGTTDIWNPADAIYSAANYLCQNGAGNPRKLYGAIFRYNHADWYVQMVLRVAASLTIKYPG